MLFLEENHFKKISFLKFFRSHNFVRDWREFDHLSELPVLEDLLFIGNPLEEDASANNKYIDEVTKRLLVLRRLDGYPVIRDLVEEVEEQTGGLTMEEIEELAK